MSSLPYETTLSVISAPDGVLDARHELPLFTNRNTVPVSQRVAEACAVECHDATGGEMMLAKVAARGTVLDSTWAAFVVMCDYRGRVIFRAIRGSVFARAARTAHADLLQNDGNAMLLQQQAAAAFDRSQQPRGSTAGDAAKLFAWARGLEAGLAERIHASHDEGGLGIPVDMFDAGGFFLSPPSSEEPPPSTPVPAHLSQQAAAIEAEIRVLSARLERGSGGAAPAPSPPSLPPSQAAAAAGAAAGGAAANGRASPGSQGSRGSRDSAVSEIASNLVRAGVPQRASKVAHRLEDEVRQ